MALKLTEAATPRRLTPEEIDWHANDPKTMATIDHAHPNAWMLLLETPEFPVRGERTYSLVAYEYNPVPRVHLLIPEGVKRFRVHCNGELTGPPARWSETTLEPPKIKHGNNSFS